MKSTNFKTLEKLTERNLNMYREVSSSETEYAASIMKTITAVNGHRIYGAAAVLNADILYDNKRKASINSGRFYIFFNESCCYSGIQTLTLPAGTGKFPSRFHQWLL
jgi:hypothetical protein